MVAQTTSKNTPYEAAQRQRKVVLKKSALVGGIAALGLGLGFCMGSGDNRAPDLMPGAPTQGASDEDRPTMTARPSLTVRPQSAGDPGAMVDDAVPLAEAAPVPLFEDHYHPFLDDEPDDVSVSIGTVTNGYLVGASHLPLPARTYDILPRQKARGLAFGSDNLIDLIEYTATVLHRTTGRRLWVGNIGRRGGGDIPWSVSHNSGRDADLAFAYTNPRGVPVDPPDLVTVDKNGVSTSHNGYYRFDAKRTWIIVRSLLAHPRSQIQFLFIANPLKKKLIDHARKSRASGALIRRAEKVLAQPGYSSPHNDHLHVRIYCSRRDVMNGCVNTGTVQSGTSLYAKTIAQRVTEVTRFLTSPREEMRARAIERLVLLRASGKLDRIQKGLEDPSARVRAAAATALGDMGTQRHVAALSARFDKEETAAVQAAMLDALQRLGGPKAGALLARVIADPAFDKVPVDTMPREISDCFVPFNPATEDGVPLLGDDRAEAFAMLPVNAPQPTGATLDLTERPLSLRLAAIEAAARIERPEPVGALIGALSDDDPLIRSRAARALHRLTNHHFGVAWADPATTPEMLQSGVAQWSAWLDRFAGQSRDSWLAAGFLASGYQVPIIERRTIWEIVRAVPGPNYLSYNAQRTLMGVSNHRPQSLTWPKTDAAWHWTRWFKRRRAKFRIGPPPAALAPYNR